MGGIGVHDKSADVVQEVFSQAFDEDWQLIRIYGPIIDDS